MNSKRNKVKYNLFNVHFAPLTFDEQDTPEWEEPFRHPGAVSLSLDPQGGSSSFKADGITYFQSTANNGYEGDLEMALLTEEFRTKILGEEKDANGVMVEKSNARNNPFAILFEVEGDSHNRRCLFWYCTATRPGMGGKTKDDSIEPETDTITITALPMPGSYLVQAYTAAGTNKATFDSWYKKVYYDPETTQDAALSGLSIGSLSLVPAFDPDITVYTATTTNSTNTVTVECAEGVEASITVNGNAIESGSAATWKEGGNTLVVVARCGDVTRAYTVMVEKE